MNSVIIVLACTGMLILSLRHRALAIAVIAALLPSYVVRTTVFGVPITLLEGLVLTTSAVCVFNILFRGEWKHLARMLREHRAWRFVCWSACIFACIGAISVLASPDIRAALGIYKAYIVEPALFACVTLATLRRRKDVQQVLWGLLIGGTVIACIAIVQFFTGVGIPEPWNTWPDRRATAIYGFPNAVGLYLAPLTTLAIGLLLFWRDRSRRTAVALAAFITIGVAAIITSRSDGAVVAVAAATFCMLLTTRTRIAAISIAAILFTAAILLPATRDILTFHDVSGQVRIALWTGTVEMLQAQPLFGSGLAGFPMTYDIYRLASHVELLEYAHNLILDFWSQFGIAGFFWIIAMILWMLIHTLCIRGNDRAFARALCGVVIAFIVYGFVDVPYFKNDLSLLFWIFVALIASLRSIERE